jgi:hypothetical protein
LTPTRPEIGSHHAPSPSITRDAAPASPLICLPSSHIVLHVAAITAGLRVQIGSTPEPRRSRFVRVKKADIITTQSRASRVSACQISLKPRASAYSAISNS